MSKYDFDYGEAYERPPLVPGEQILWQAKPKRNAFIINKALGMLPIALIWLLFDGFILGQMFAGGGGSLILVPFMLVHLMPVWIWLGNVITASRRWKNTVYYVTDRRILIQTGFVDRNLQTVYYKDIRHVDLRVGLIDRMLGVGDVYFDLGEYHSGGKTRSLNKAFLDIEDPKAVYNRIQKIILDIQTDIHYPNALRPEENPGYQTKYNG